MLLVDVGLLQSLSYVAAAIGVCTAAAYYVMNLRYQNRTRQAQLFMQVHARWADRAFIKGFYDILNIWDWKDFDDWGSKYGQRSNEEAFLTFCEIIWYFDGVGLLVREGLIDIGLVEAIYLDRVINLWEKGYTLAMGLRELNQNPDYYGNFEYLYREMKKRQVKSSTPTTPDGP
jgi:hypothetical protein